jgi:hypothetical protein
MPVGKVSLYSRRTYSRDGNHKKFKSHMLGYRFSREFEIRALGYGFLFGNHKHLAKNSGDMWFVDFFLKIFKIHVGIDFFSIDFWLFECVSSMFC